MEAIHVISGLLSVLIIAVIGVYAFGFKINADTNKKIADIYRLINIHIQNPSIHRLENEFVKQPVCNTIQKLHKERTDEINKNLDEIKRDIKTLIKR